MNRTLEEDLRAVADRTKAAFFPRFFKTRKGEYGEGDVFIGVTVPQIRSAIKVHLDIPLPRIKTLLRSPIHEFRLAALLILVTRFQKGDLATKKLIATFYLANIQGVNNWDLVDSSAHQILGAYLDTQKSTALLRTFAQSGNLWKERIAIVATYHFIRQTQFTETFQIATLLLHHPHDLIQKAVGWMLREVGKRDQEAEEIFLQRQYNTMPRTMLRYAIERFSAQRRQAYLKGKI